VNASEVRNERIGLKAGSLALLAVVLWGGNSVSIKIGLEGMPPVAMAGARFLLGALTVAVGALLSGISLRVPTARWIGLAGLGLLFCVQIGLLNVGTHLTNASRSTVLICTYPFFTAFFAHFLIPGDRLSASKVTGLLLSFAGVVLIFAESLGTGYLLGDALVLISGMLLGLRQVVIKRLVSGLHPFQVVFWQAALSLPVFAGVSGLFERDTVWELSMSVIGAVLFQGVVIAGFCFILMASLLKRHRASTLGAFGFVTPVFGVLLSVLLLGEELSPLLAASLVLVAIGIVVVNRDGGESRG
jgi:drug/metabolite transporter (DMT)-like permease